MLSTSSAAPCEVRSSCSLIPKAVRGLALPGSCSCDVKQHERRLSRHVCTNPGQTPAVTMTLILTLEVAQGVSETLALALTQELTLAPQQAGQTTQHSHSL